MTGQSSLRYSEVLVNSDTPKNSHSAQSLIVYLAFGQVQLNTEAADTIAQLGITRITVQPNARINLMNDQSEVQRTILAVVISSLCGYLKTLVSHALGGSPESNPMHLPPKRAVSEKNACPTILP